MFEYRRLEKEEINVELFKDFNRYQKVEDIYYLEKGDWIIKKNPFIDNWKEDEYKVLLGYLLNTLKEGGVVMGVFDEDKLIGFSSLEGVIFGKDYKYLDLTSIHISYDYRGKGLGKKLFLIMADEGRKLGADKLYISSHSAIETQKFYSNLGCVDALEINEEKAKAEPYDRQLEYNL